MKPQNWERKTAMNKLYQPLQVVSRDGKPQVLQQVLEVKQASERVLDLFIYDDIKPDSFNFMTWDYEESETSAKWIKNILDKNANASEIRLFVNSRGGYVKEAMSIRAELLRHAAHKVAFIDGYAASAASFLITACEEVKMLSGSMQMLHNMIVNIEGNANELRKAADDLDKLMEGNRQIYLEKVNIDEARLIEIMEAETWLNAAECVQIGLADEVLTASEYAKLTSFKQGASTVTAEAKQQLFDDVLEGKKTIVEARQALGLADLKQSQPEIIEPVDIEKPLENPTQEDAKMHLSFLAAALKAAERANQ